MIKPIDLDALQASYARNRIGDNWPMFTPATMNRLIAELRAARKVVEAVAEESEAEWQVAIQSPGYAGLGPDEVFERRDAARHHKWAALTEYKEATK